MWLIWFIPGYYGLFRVIMAYSDDMVDNDTSIAVR